MDKAIIFGIYDFVSFHACKALLNKGVEVTGVHLQDIYKHQFLEEKRLEIGRNANYSELSLSEWEDRRENDEVKTTFIFSIYDLFMLNKEIILQKEEVTRPILQYMDGHKNNIEVVFILPIQMLISNKEKTLSEFLDRAKGWNKNNQLIYLPSIYGTWQPSTFSFQQALISKLQKIEISINDREWKKDVLYVNDAVESIIEIIESANTENVWGYLLESGKKDYWNQCAVYLQMDEEFTKFDRLEPLQMDKQIVKVSAKKVTGLADSITEQMEQVQYLFQK